MQQKVDTRCVMLQDAAMQPKKKKKYLRGLPLVELAAKEKPVLRARAFLPAVDLLRQKGFSLSLIHISEPTRPY